MNKRTFIIFIFFTFVGRCLYAGGEDSRDIEEIQEKIKSQQQELSQLEKEIGEYSKNIKNFTEREKRLMNDINEIDDNISEKQNKLISLQDNVSDVKIKIFQLSEKLKQKKKTSRKYSSYLKDSLKYYYFKKNRYKIMPWFTAFFYNEITGNFLAEKVVNIPTEKYLLSEKEIEEITNIKKELEEKKSNLLLLKEQVVGIQNSFIVRRKKQLKILRNIKEEREDQQSRLKKLRQEKDKLDILIGSLKKKVKNLERLTILSKYFTEAKGRIPWPIWGDIISKFGKQKHFSLDAYVFNRGIKIQPFFESDVKAVAGGEVVYSDNFSGLGNMVVIDHGNGYYTIYGDLDNVFVKVGQEIGPFHSLGDLAEKSLYFELGQGSTPEDPLIWLLKP